MRRCLIYFLLCISWVPVGSATELTRSKQELIVLQQKIDRVKQDLDEELGHADSITNEIDEIEQSLVHLNQSIRQHKSDKKALENEVKQLTVNAKFLADKNKDAQYRLGQLLKSGYQMGQQSGLRLLLNQKNPNVLSRQLIQFRYIMAARNQQLHEIAASQQTINENKTLLAARKLQLEQTTAQVEIERRNIEAKEQAKTNALQKVERKIAATKSNIVLYQKRETALKKLLLEIAASQRQTKLRQNQQKEQNRSTKISESTNVTSAPSEKILSGFSHNKGRLSHPINARVHIKFGQKKQQNGLPLEGVLYGSQSGQSVKAIYPGQIVFSDWFRGYGQLVVLNHGDGYMSVYGNNQSLTYAVGQTVEAGQVIAVANAASSDPTPGLYFEIRHHGTPFDPLQWVR